MAQYLRDFAATVLKARQFADIAESTRPKRLCAYLRNHLKL